MILRCEKCRLAITITEKDDCIIISESELLLKSHAKEAKYRCPYCKEIMEIEE